MTTHSSATRRIAPTLLAIGTLAPMLAAAAPASIDLGDYTLVGSFLLPPVEAEEASAITYNWDTDTLFVLGDEGDALVEVSKTGTKLSAMSLTGFADTEGLTYIGAGQFVITEERIRDAYRFSYTAGGSVNRASLPVKDLGTDVGNSGIEGISYDARDGSFVTVKEVSPQEVNRVQMDFASATSATITPLFAPSLGVGDLADVFALGSVPSLASGPDGDHLLIYSQASSRLLEVSRAGAVLSSFDFSALAGDAEGVTMDFDGNIYVVAEGGPNLFVLAPPTPVPLPPSLALALGGGALIGLRARRR